MKATEAHQPFAAEPNTLIIEDVMLGYGFIQLPKQILYARNLSRDAKVLYAVLLGYAWQELKCFPGYARLCHDMMASENTVRKCMRELEAVSLLAQRRRGLGKTNIYLLRDIRTSKIEVQEPPQFEVQEPAHLEVPEPSHSEVYKEPEEKEPDEYLSNIRMGKNAELNVDNSGSHVDKPSRNGSSASALKKESEPNNNIPSSVALKDAASSSRNERISSEPESIGAVLKRGRGRPPKQPYSEDRQQITAYIQDFAREMGDQAPLKSSVTRADNLYQASGRSIALFVDAMYQARAKTKERTAAIHGKPNAAEPFAPKAKMAYFFALLEDELGMREGGQLTLDA